MNGARNQNTRGIVVSVCLVVLGMMLAAVLQAQTAIPASAAAIPSDRLVQAEQLNRELQAHPHGALILQVGSRVLFEQAHIPGAEYAGPAARPEGLQMLRARVAKLPRSRDIVIYCGCCPWDRCPNLGPAWNELRQMGFTHVRALYIPNNFGADWVAKGFRAEQSH